MVAAGRAAWPTLALDAATFVQHLGRHLPAPAVADDRAWAALHASDLFLACACAAGDPRALALFERQFLSRVSTWIAQVDRTPHFVDEVLQLLRARLLVGPQPRIGDYNGSGPLEAWARIAAVRVALNAQRRIQRRQPLPDLPEPGVDPEIGFIQRRNRADAEAALKTALSRLGQQERELVRRHYIDGASLQIIGEERNVDKSTISRHLAAARRFLLAETRRELKRRAPMMSTSTCNSLLRAMDSQIQLSLATALASRK
jgi:RNA polymerase sigma-70 factor (ECF subfamily)